jgi:hypothetical protein
VDRGGDALSVAREPITADDAPAMRLRRSFVAHVAVLVFLWTSMGLALTALFVWGAVTFQRELDAELQVWRTGERATDVELMNVERIRSKHGDSYRLDVKWRDQGGRIHLTPYRGDNALDLESGQLPVVRYDPRDPEHIALSIGLAHAHLRQRWVYLAAFGALVMPLLCGWLTWQQWRSLRDARRAGRGAAIVRLRVAGVEERGGRTFGKLSVTVDVPQASGRSRRQQQWFEAQNPPIFVDDSVIALRAAGAARVVVVARDLAPFAVDERERAAFHDRVRRLVTR